MSEERYPSTCALIVFILLVFIALMSLTKIVVIIGSNEENKIEKYSSTINAVKIDVYRHTTSNMTNEEKLSLVNRSCIVHFDMYNDRESCRYEIISSLIYGGK